MCARSSPATAAPRPTKVAKRKSNKVATAAAAAAAAAVRASQEDETDTRLNWAAEIDDDEDDAEINDEILQGLAQIDEQAGGEIVWWELYCDSPIDKAGQIRKLSTSEIKGVRDECLLLGPGEYHVIARHKKGTFIKGSRLRIKISGFARPAATPAAPAQASGMDPMLMMQRWDERAEQRRQAAKAERDQQIKFWAPILAPIGVELAKGLMGRGGGESIKDLVAAMVGMKELVGGGKSESSVDTLLKGIELARDLAPDAKGSTWPDVLVSGITQVTKELRPLAETLVNRRNAPTPAGAPAGGPAQLQFAPTAALPAATPASNGSTAAAGASPAPGPNTTEDPMWAVVEPLLRRLAGELEEFAVNGTDPGLTAEALLAKIPRLIKNQVQPQQMKEWLTQPDWWSVLVAFHPGIANHQGFCDDVRLSLLDIVEQQLNPTPEEPEEE